MWQKIIGSINANKIGFALRVLLVVGLGWLYFRHVLAMVLLLPVAVLLQLVSGKRRGVKSERLVLSQFRDLLIAVASSLSAGATLEGGFKMAPTELMVIWSEKAIIICQLRVLLQRLRMNISIETAIADMSLDLNLEECARFSEVVAICKHSGGNMVTAVRACANALTEKLDALFEIDSILAQRRLERNILVCVPHCMLALLAILSPDYVELLYATPYGRVAALISLLFSGVAWIVSERIIDVKV